MKPERALQAPQRGSRGPGRPIALLALLGLSLSILAGLLAPAPVDAHIVPVGLGMQTYVRVEPRRVYLEYNLGFSDFAGYDEVLRMEADRNGILTQAEIDAWMDLTQPKLLAGLEVTLDGKRLTFTRLERKVYALFPDTDVRKLNGAPFDTWWYFESAVEIPPGEHVLTWKDRCFERDVRQTILWLGKGGPQFETFAFEPEPRTARYLDVGTDWQVFAGAAKLYVEFSERAYREQAAADAAARAAGSSGAGPAGAAGTSPSGTATAAGGSAPGATTATAAALSQSPAMQAFAEKSAQDLGVRYRGAEEIDETKKIVGLRDEVWYMALLLAALWGAGHALAPGHGKSLVAAHLVGEKGTVADAVKVGLAVTLSHSVANFALALAAIGIALALGVKQASAVSYGALGVELGGGALIFLWGVGLLFLRLQGLDRKGHAHDHDHDHDHDHGHSHGLFGHHHHGPAGETGHTHPQGARSTLWLGLVAGFQPCTAGITLVLVSFQQQWLFWGLVVLTVFSLGLGAVITAVAVAVVTGKGALAERLDEGRLRTLLRVAPALSALLVTAVGAYMVIDGLARNQLGPWAAP